MFPGLDAWTLLTLGAPGASKELSPLPHISIISLRRSSANMASILPPFPRFVFTIFEPIALVAGYLSPMLDTKGFVNSQLPATALTSISPTATNRLLAL